MEVILLEKILNTGDFGELVDVKKGFARNYLIPQGKAVFATEDAKEKVEQKRAELAKLEKDKIEGAKARAALLPANFSIEKLCQDEGRLYGSVSSSDIAQLLSNENFTVDKSEVILPEDGIKNIGSYLINIRLHADVITKVDLEVIEQKA